MSYYYGVTPVAAGTKSFANSVGGQGTSCVVIGNESGLTHKVSFEGTTASRSLYPGIVDLFDIPPGWNGNITFASSELVSLDWPSSFVQIDVFGINERPAAAAYPFSLARATQVGGTVATTGGVASSIVNSGNPAGTHLIDSSPAGDLTNAVTLTNRGQLILGDAINDGYFELAYPGTFQIDVAPGNVSGGNITLSTDFTGALLISTNGGAHQVIIQGNQNIILDAANGKIDLNTVGLVTGTISGISKFSAAVTTTSTFFNHGLGVVPDLVFCIPDGAAAVTNRIVEVEYGSLTSTQCKLTAGASFNVVGVAIKF